ncbi:MAG: hypothetical protein AAGH15_03485 [Myxococcota bacterium]
MKPSFFLLLVLLVSSLVACESAARSTADGGVSDVGVARCVPGRSLPCACPDGASGAQLCRDDGTFAPCSCAGEGPDPLPAYCETTPPRTDTCVSVDLLFVVDNSLSMAPKQASLTRAFPAFAEDLRRELAGVDTHVMVVDTDGDTGRGLSECLQRCEINATFEPPPGCDVEPFEECFPPELCAGFDCETPPITERCDRLLGAGVTFSAGLDAPNVRCTYATGRRWTTLEDPNLVDALSCAATVGSSGSGNEAVLGAMVEAFAEGGEGPGGCNEGFFRPDALLVVVLLSDASAANGSMEAMIGDADAFRRELQALKCNDPNAIVVLGLVGDGDLPGGLCEDGLDASPLLRELVEGFEDRGFLGSICEEDYAPFLRDAVGLIDRTCDLI